MLLLNDLVGLHHQPQPYLFTAYADNWQLIDHSVDNLSHQVQHVSQHHLPMDAKKTETWGVRKADKDQLRDGGAKVVTNTKDLGYIMTYDNKHHTKLQKLRLQNMDEDCMVCPQILPSLLETQTDCHWGSSMATLFPRHRNQPNCPSRLPDPARQSSKRLALETQELAHGPPSTLSYRGMLTLPGSLYGTLLWQHANGCGQYRNVKTYGTTGFNTHHKQQETDRCNPSYRCSTSSPGASRTMERL